MLKEAMLFFLIAVMLACWMCLGAVLGYLIAIPWPQMDGVLIPIGGGLGLLYGLLRFKRLCKKLKW